LEELQIEEIFAAVVGVIVVSLKRLEGMGSE
jgi:hypothetical protein